jgi:hypothetical protein
MNIEYTNIKERLKKYVVVFKYSYWFLTHIV